MKFRFNNDRGVVLIIVMGAVMIMGLTTIFLGNMLVQNGALIRNVKYTAQAHYLAEAGISHALARIKNESFASRTDIAGSMDTGSYSVVFTEDSGRHLVTSTGEVRGVKKRISVEIENLMPSAMSCISAAGNNIRINSFVANAAITGKIHANNNVYLKSGAIIATLLIRGKVSATGEVKEGTILHQRDGLWGGFLDYHVYINGDNDDTGEVFEDEDRVVFPTFDYDRYREMADDSGDYYATDQVFNGASLSPSNGIVYVDGDVDFRGNCELNGGIIADSITIWGVLQQNKAGTRNVIIARTGDVAVAGELSTEEAVVYAGRDIFTLQALAKVDVNGILMARRDIYMWNFITYITYSYLETYPSDIGDDENQSFGIVSWNF